MQTVNYLTLIANKSKLKELIFFNQLIEGREIMQPREITPSLNMLADTAANSKYKSTNPRISTKELDFLITLINQNENRTGKNKNINWKKITPLMNEWLESQGLKGARNTQSYWHVIKKIRGSLNDKSKPKSVSKTQSVFRTTLSLHPSDSEETLSFENYPIKKAPITLTFKEGNRPFESNRNNSKPINILTPFYRKQTWKNQPRTTPAVWSNIKPEKRYGKKEFADPI